MTDHRTVTLTDPWGHSVKVDEGMTPLVAALWTCGVGTAQRCQEQTPGYAWVAFLDADDLREFLSVVADPDDEDTWERLSNHDRSRYATSRPLPPLVTQCDQ